MTVQARIEILVDYHDHEAETEKLALMGAAGRHDFLKQCGEDLYGSRQLDFLNLCNSSVFEPLLATSSIGEPDLATIRSALQTAVDAYNAAKFGFVFDIAVSGTTMEGTIAVPDYACVQWVWVNGEWVKRYNYDLSVNTTESSTSLRQDLTTGLKAAYRISLVYTTPTAVPTSSTSFTASRIVQKKSATGEARHHPAAGGTRRKAGRRSVPAKRVSKGTIAAQPRRK